MRIRGVRRRPAPRIRCLELRARAKAAHEERMTRSHRSIRSKRTARPPARRRARHPSDVRVLRFRTYLTPSIPKSLFAYLTAYLGEQLGARTELQVVMTH